jgi:hypothetical protein
MGCVEQATTEEESRKEVRSMAKKMLTLVMALSVLGLVFGGAALAKDKVDNDEAQVEVQDGD